MTETFFPIVAAELGDTALFDTLVPLSYAPHLRGDFDALAETPGNDAVNFLTGAGGFLQQVIFGYSGLRLDESGLARRFKPLLPPGVRRITLKDFSVRGKRCDIVVEPGGVTFVNR